MKTRIYFLNLFYIVYVILDIRLQNNKQFETKYLDRKFSIEQH